MSNTQRQQHGPSYCTKAVKSITSQASTLIKSVGEKNDAVRKLAYQVIHEFYYVEDPNLRMSFGERKARAVDIAMERSAEIGKNLSNKQVDYAIALGARALELSSQVYERKCSGTKAHRYIQDMAKQQPQNQASPSANGMTRGTLRALDATANQLRRTRKVRYHRRPKSTSKKKAA